jgi:mannose/fructose-specific phosphotransferase system component IIA
MRASTTSRSALVPRLVEGAPLGRPIALGLDVRNRDFNATALIELIDSLTRDPRVDLEVLYLDCAPGVLIQRYSETRRRHPLAPNETPAQGIDREIDLLAPVRVRADHLIDTTDLTQHDLKAELAAIFDITPLGRLSVSVQSFSYKRGIPRGVDMIFDCRFLANPTGKGLCGRWMDAIRRSPPSCAPIPAFRRLLPKVSELLFSASGPSGRGQGASCHWLWLYRRATQVGCCGGNGREGACRGRLAGVKTAPGTGTQGCGTAAGRNEGGERLIGIVIVAHGGLAREYLSAVEHVVGRQDGVRAISIEDDHDRSAKQDEICAAADAVDTGQGVVLVTDMFGGSPSNLSLPACATTGRRILYGANLPMLIKLAKSRDLGVPDAVAAALDAGRKYINSLDLGGGA